MSNVNSVIFEQPYQTASIYENEQVVSPLSQAERAYYLVIFIDSCSLIRLLITY